MGLLVVTDGTSDCPLCGTPRVARCQYPREATLALKESGSSTVILVGITKPDPLDWVCDLREAAGDKSALGIAVIRSASEVRALREASMGNWSHASALIQNQISRPLMDRSDANKRVIDIRARQVSSDGRRMVCSATEFRLLMFLLRYPDVVFSRRELLARIRSNDQPVDPQMIDVLVRRLRHKIGEPQQAHLQTVYGLGYRFWYGNAVFMDALTHQPFVSWPHRARLGEPHRAVNGSHP
jgi:DNA-binding winged helix-turn-helix (wHTH) protein